MCVRARGIPCHAWNKEFFSLANAFGSYICSDDSTLKRMNMDDARFLVRISGKPGFPRYAIIYLLGRFPTQGKKILLNAHLFEQCRTCYANKSQSTRCRSLWSCRK